MSTILFIHREELTYLYLMISKYLLGKVNIIHVAYSNKEEKILRANGITRFINFSYETDKLFSTEKLDNNLLKEIDNFLIANTKGRFNLNQAIQSDRGFSILAYNEALLIAQVYYKFWIKVFNEYDINYVIHEPCSLFFNHICAIICQFRGGKYIWHSMVVGENNDFNYLNGVGDDYSCPEIEKFYNYYLDNPDKIDVSRCLQFLNKIRSSYSIYLGNIINPKQSKLSLYYKVLRERISMWTKRKKFDRLRQNIDYWLVTQAFYAQKLKNINDYAKENLNFEDLPQGESYYYYSFHLEPEAVVLYLGDGIYTNQIKLIENIAAAIPPNTYLYVKDHPHEYGYRKVSDYIRLKNIPNIRLLKQDIPGKLVIKDAIGVFTINGTAGFEALMLGKQVYAFGWSYYCYCPRVNYVQNIRHLREIIYKNQDFFFEDNQPFLAYVNAYLDSLHSGMVDYFMGRSELYGVDQQQNTKQIADDLIKFANEFGRKNN